MKKFNLCCILCAGLCVFSSYIRAQNAISTGSISGQVTDASGGAVVGATVTAASEEAGVKLTTKTNGTGFFSFPSLRVGAYDVRVTETGFKTAVVNSVQVQVGQNAAANVTLQVGEVTQSVIVTAEAPLL
jgi:Carboxypeptidase regulatory-like domain